MGVHRSATDKEIKAAFKKLARKFHPDLHPGEKVETKFKDISAANDLLKISDGPAPSVHINKAEKDWFSVDIWRTHDMPAKIVPKAEEPTAGPRRQMPTPNGTVLRINSFPPESKALRMMTPADSLRVFEGLGNPKAATFGKGGRHPMMHRTESIDYALILSGEITMLLDDEEVLLKTGDVVVQCGPIMPGAIARTHRVSSHSS